MVFQRRIALGALAAALAVVAATPTASAEVALTYLPPVAPGDGVIVEHFRPPPTPYSAGNRGVDYLTRPGAPVVAPAAGVARFAGPVAGRLVVTLLHPDGLRTTDTGLAAIAVTVGQAVVQGQVVGWAGSTLHFGVRAPDGTYLDPEALFAGRLGARLVPGPRRGRRPAAGRSRDARPRAASAAARTSGSSLDPEAAAAAFETRLPLAARGRLAPGRVGS